jgi:hypothetical protein
MKAGGTNCGVCVSRKHHLKWRHVSAAISSLRGAKRTTLLRLLRKLRRAWSPPKLGERRRKQSSFLVAAKEAGLLRFRLRHGFGGQVARNDGERHALSFSQRVSLECCQFVVPLLKRGRRESRTPTAPAAPCAESSKRMHTGLTGTAETSRLSPRNGFTAYTCSPRGSGLSCPRCQRQTCRQRGARVAAPGPHDFAGRCQTFRPVKRSPDASCGPSQPAPRSVTIAKRPFGGTG